LLEKSIKLQKNLKKAMRYPLFLLSVAIIVSLVMLLFVLPKFADIYRDFDAELPFFTYMPAMLQTVSNINNTLVCMINDIAC
jgi:Type II secretory pathway, component PulF